MKIARLLLFTVLAFASFTVSLPAHSAEATKDAAKEKEAEMMKKFMEASTPGASHKVLNDMVGEFTMSSKAWHAADAKPMEGKGTASMAVILGGRWLQYKVQQATSGEFPGFEGLGLLGYDNVKKSYKSIWLDTQSTSAMIGDGQFDAGSKTLKETGVYSCPLTGKDRSYRSNWQIKDKNTLIFSLYGTSPFGNDNKEFKMLELTMKRK